MASYEREVKGQSRTFMQALGALEGPTVLFYRPSLLFFFPWCCPHPPQSTPFSFFFHSKPFLHIQFSIRSTPSFPLLFLLSFFCHWLLPSWSKRPSCCLSGVYVRVCSVTLLCFYAAQMLFQPHPHPQLPICIAYLYIIFE